MSANAVTPRATRREWIGLAVLALPCLLYSMDLTVLNLAVPHLTASLQPTGAQLLWIVDIYGFLLAGLLITMGTLGDRIGRRRLLLIGATTFGIASVLAAFSTSAEMLIVTRALLGIAGATLAPSTLSLIRNMFNDPQQRTVAIGVWVTSYSIGGALGPLLGGILLEHFWWGSVFLIGVPVMLLLLVVGPTLLPEFRDPNAGRLDLTSAALSLAAVLTMIYGLKQIAQDGMGVGPVLSIVAGIGIAVTFVRRQTSLDDPMIDLRLFRVPAFSASLAAYMLGTFIAFGTFFFVFQYLQLVAGLSPIQAGVWSLPSFLSFVIGSMTTPAIAKRVAPAHMMSAGLALSSLGFALLTQVEGIGGVSGIPVIVTGSVTMSLGLAPVFTLATDLIVGTAPPERAGAAGAISETSSEFGGALGIAVLGSIGTAVYRSGVENAIPPTLTAESAEAARGTLGGALAVAAELPPRIGSELIDSSREAFTQSFELTAGISAAIAMATAIIALLLLRGVRAGDGIGEGSGPPPVLEVA